MNADTRPKSRLNRWLFRIVPMVALLVALLVAGCAGIKPYEPRDYREEGLKRGLLSGSKGEFVIYKKAGEPQTGSEAGKRSDETADGEQKDNQVHWGYEPDNGPSNWGRLNRD